MVSAMGKTTDELLALAQQVSPRPPRRELDMLLVVRRAHLDGAAVHGAPRAGRAGDQLHRQPVRHPHQRRHAHARIIEVRPFRIQDELARGKVVIVAGYQGVSYKREITTLGRGGSDTTAVALAAALGAEACEIYSDVDGVYSRRSARGAGRARLEEISYDEMQELAEQGAKVLNAQAVEFAKRKGIVILARATSGGGTGTAIRELPAASDIRVKGVTLEADLAVIAARGDAAGLPELLEFLDARGVRGRALSFDGGRRGQAFVATPLQDVHGLEALKRDLSARFGDRVRGGGRAGHGHRGGRGDQRGLVATCAARAGGGGGLGRRCTGCTSPRCKSRCWWTRPTSGRSPRGCTASSSECEVVAPPWV